MNNEELAKNIRSRIESINLVINIPQSYEAKCFLDGKRKAYQYVLDLLEIRTIHISKEEIEDKMFFVREEDSDQPIAVIKVADLLEKEVMKNETKL